VFSQNLFLENYLRLANQASSLDGEKEKQFWFTIIGERERHLSVFFSLRPAGFVRVGSLSL
jgi:hypothetical protein